MEAGAVRNNHLPLSAIPGTRVRWSADDVGRSDCATTDGNENKLLPAEGYCDALKVARSLFRFCRRAPPATNRLIMFARR